MLTFRKASFGPMDATTRAVPLVLATDTPVDRQDYIEQLDIAGADLSRGDLPLIESHDASTVNIGLVRAIRIDGSKLRGVAYFGTSARASELLADIQSGVVSGVSIGYQLQDAGTPVRTRDGREALLFKFTPYEVSVVAVPADTEAGFFRSTPSFFQKETPIMIPGTQTNATRNQAAEISAIAATFPGGAELAIRSIQDGQTVEQFQEAVIRHMATKPLGTADASSSNSAAPKKIGFARMRSAEDFRSHYGHPKTRDEANLTLQEFMLGVAKMPTSAAATRAMSLGVDTAGGFLAPPTLMPEILESLTANSSLTQAGARILPLEGNSKSYSLVGIDQLPSAHWRNENSEIFSDDAVIREINLLPKSLALVVKISRELLQDGVSADSLLFEILGQAIAKEIDRAGLLGSGLNPEPRGLANIAGVHALSNGANGAAISNYANVFSATQAILQADGRMPTAAIMSPRSAVKFGGLVDSTGQPLRTPSMLEKVSFVTSSQIPNNLTVGTSNDCSKIFVGDFSQFIFGMRENISLQVLDQTFANYGQIAFLVHARLDIAVTHPARFAIVSGVRA